MVDSNGNPISGSDSAIVDFNSISGGFACSTLYVRSLTQYGRLPTAYELSTTGYSIPGVIGSGPGTGMKGYGDTNFYCDGTSQYQGDYSFGA